MSRQITNFETDNPLQYLYTADHGLERKQAPRNIIFHNLPAFNAEPSYSYVIDSDLHTALASPGRLEDEIIQHILDEQSVEKLVTETARLDEMIVKRLPAAPWYPTIWIVLSIALVIAFLSLLHFFS